MHGWQRHRSAPVGVLFAGAITLLVTGAVATVFYLSVVRAARGLPAWTAGLPPAVVARPLARRAVYRVLLDGPADRTTPAGTPSTAHRWRVAVAAAPDDALCEGAADDALVAADESGVRAVAVPLPPWFYRGSGPRPVPPLLLATCPAAAEHAAQGGLEYVEDVAPRALAVEIVACTDPTQPDAPLAPCDDGAPSRIYQRETRAQARVRARGAMLRVGLCAGAFALVCFAVGVLALRRFDRERKAGPA